MVFNRDNGRETTLRVNERIFAKSVQVISQTGQNLGIMPTSEAMKLAESEGLDLVEINSSSVSPIVKIMDYGKFKYDQKKRANKARKHQKTVEIKEVWIVPFIEENDLKVKMKKIFEFLEDGDKVKVSVMTRGSKRVLAQGREFVPALFERILEIIGSKGVLESKSKPEERTKSIIIAPAK